jgi:hypothetical protein
LKYLALPILVLWLCLGGAASAQEEASQKVLTLDLDGDGAPETVRVTQQPAPEDSPGADTLLQVQKGNATLYERLLEGCYFEDFHKLPLKGSDGGALLCYTCASGANYMYTDCLARQDGRFRFYSLPGFLNTSPDAPADLDGDGVQDFQLAACYSVGGCYSGRENELFLKFDGREFLPLIPGGFYAAHLVDLDGGGLLVVGLRAGTVFDTVELWGASGGQMRALRSVLLPSARRGSLDEQWQDPPEAPTVGKSLSDSRGFRIEYAGVAFQTTATQASLDANPLQRFSTPGRMLGGALKLLFPAFRTILDFPKPTEPTC